MRRTLDDLADHPALSYTLDEACLLAFPRRDITDEQAGAAGHGRPLPPAGIDGVYAATDPTARVIALLEDQGPRTKSVVVIRPATLLMPPTAGKSSHIVGLQRGAVAGAGRHPLGLGPLRADHRRVRRRPPRARRTHRPRGQVRPRARAFRPS